MLVTTPHLELRALRHGVQHLGAGHAGGQSEDGEGLRVRPHYVQDQPVQAVEVVEAEPA